MTTKPTYKELEQELAALRKTAHLRRQAEEKLKKDQGVLQSIFSASTETIILVDTAGTIIALNDVAAQRLGKDKAHLVGMGIFEYFPPDIAESRMKKKDEAIRSGQPVRFQDERQGRFYENNYCPVFDARGLVHLIAIFARDITERKEWEQALQASERRFKELFENAPVMYVIAELREGDAYIVETNNLFLETLGYSREEVLNFPLAQYYTEASKKTLADRILYNQMQRGTFTTEERAFVTRDGRTIYTLMHARPEVDADGQGTGIRMMYLNISRRRQAETRAKRLESALQQAQKMEAIGTLAGGIAHDFNNILSAIIGYTELAELDLEDTERARRNIKEALKASMRAKDLVNQILVFSRKGEEGRKPIQIVPILMECLNLLKATLPATIEIHQQFESDVDIIEADPSRIHQVIMNLCANAGQAMRETGGLLSVKLSTTILGDDVAARYPEIAPGKYIKLTVSDTGPGMPASLKDKIFEPYFTTKAKGEGTGLGLAIVHRIVNNYGGLIELDSAPGKGATFHVYLPVSGGQTVEDPENSEPPPTGDERILYVDDEPTLIDIGSQILTSLGYKVSASSGSRDALALFQSSPDQFDLVITDMTMPHMTGEDLAKALMAIRSDIPIILCSGFSERIDENGAKQIGIRAYVKKPIIIHDIAHTVRAVLDGNTDRPVAGRSGSGC